MVEESFGKSAKGNVDEIRADHLPCILIVYKIKGAVDIRNIVQGMELHVHVGSCHTISSLNCLLITAQTTYNYIQ